MRDIPKATAVPGLSPGHTAKQPSRLWRLIQRAPGPEAPDSRDKAAAQRGMIILLAAGGLFWVGVAAVVVYLLS